MSLGILHRAISAGSSGSDAAPPGSPSWRTCLREVIFFEDALMMAHDPGCRTPLAGGDAYGFLLETICGLHSPMLGETQVLGQFRTFLASLPPPDAAWLGRIGQQLITDARAIREWHLRGLGSRSYGSAVRRHVAACEVVAIIGAGSLAGELLPYLAEHGRIDRWGRQDIARADARAACTQQAALIVAAPVRGRAVEQVAGRYLSLASVLDLRAADERDALAIKAPVITLDALFSSVGAAAAASSSRVEPALREIAQRAAAFDRRQQVRPFGWDDLCA